MKTLQQYRITLQSGKEIKKEPIGNEKRINDSVAEHLLLQTDNLMISETERSTQKKSIQIFNIWEDDIKALDFKKLKTKK